jgi:hypothetical protein
MINTKKLLWLNSSHSGVTTGLRLVGISIAKGHFHSAEKNSAVRLAKLLSRFADNVVKMYPLQQIRC